MPSCQRPIAKATFIDLGYITNACSLSALEIKCFRNQVAKVKVKSAHHHFPQLWRLPSNRAITGGTGQRVNTNNVQVSLQA